MEKKELKAKDIPMGYPLCFNDDCAKKDTCMHYQARLLMPKEQFYGQAVYPIAWQDGECHFYHEKKLIKKAWGFSKLYNNVPKHQRAEARQYVSSLFGRGNGIYYRIHHRENMTLRPRIYSLNGNDAFPYWEHFIPLLGMFCSLTGNKMR